MRLRTRSANPGYRFGTTEPAVQEAIAGALETGAVFYDLGANVGFFSLVAAKVVGPTGYVYAFEPAPDTAEELRRNIALNSLDHVEVLEVAVSDFDGQGRLAGDSLDARLGNQGTAVPVVRLDSLEIRPPSLVKIDVETAERQVLEGMRELIEAHQPTILCEMHMQGPVAEAVDRLSEWLPGYLVEPVEKKPVMARPHLLARPR